MAAAAIRRIVATVRPGAVPRWRRANSEPSSGLREVSGPSPDPRGTALSPEEGSVQGAMPTCWGRRPQGALPACRGGQPQGALPACRGRRPPLPAPAPPTGAELCLSQPGGEVGTVLPHVHGSSVNGFQGCSVQDVPDLQALLSHPCTRSLCSKGPSGWPSYRVWGTPPSKGDEDPCQICRGVWCLPTARHGWELASSRR